MFKKALTGAAVALSLLAAPALAEWKPNGPVTMVTMFPPGGGGDVLSRAVAKHFEDTLGWNVVVDNKPGGGGAAMAKILKDSPADGMTIGFAVSETFSFAPVMNPKVGYGATDFTFLGSNANTQIGWIAPADAPYNSLEDLVAAAKDGADIAVGVFSPRSNAAVRAIGKKFGVTFTPIPFKSGAEGISNVMNGHVTTTLAAGPQAPHVRAGDLKVLASFEADRLVVGADAKTVSESGVDVATFRAKWMLAAPAGLPQEAESAWKAAVESTMGNDELRAFITDKMSLKMVFTPAETLRDEIVGGRSANETLIGFLR
nr:tripartite tricarboxylate transporter substrate binding protein [Amylibacter sp.]